MNPTLSLGDPFYVTTPIYYVNDRPHIGHCYTTLVADVAARTARLLGRDTFFLTGTDEHAEKVSRSAAEHGLSPQAWADQNAAKFRDAFDFMRFSHDDFIRTSEDRHKTRATAMIQQLMDQGDIELGDYHGWYDPSQEEYLTETTAKEHDYKSPVTGKPLEQRTEQNYFFRLDKYESWLRGQIESGAVRVLPEARKNEVLGRLKDGLNKVPVSRRIKPGDADWGITMPGDPDHRVYVWIEALCNYVTAIDTPERAKYWPASVHFMAKDILWFHAVIWPAMLHALGKAPPKVVYAHAYFIAEGRKMSKSLGNFIEIDQLRAYAERYSVDAVRWYLATQGPLGATDADWAYSRFVEVYNADLANGIGNATSRVAQMIEKYLEGSLPHTCEGRFGFPDGKALQAALAARERAGNMPSGEMRTFDLAGSTVAAASRTGGLLETGQIDESTAAGVALVREIDDFITYAAPFTLAKHAEHIEHGPKALSAILYSCAEALRIASLFFYPAMPDKMAELWRRWGCDHLTDPSNPDSAFKAPLAELAQFGTGRFSLKPGQKIAKGDPLFMRADTKLDAPA